jgi:hypothetical protein
VQGSSEQLEEAHERFQLSVPPDFLNLSPGAPAENFARASDMAGVRGLQQARDSDPRSNTAWVGGLLMAMGAGAALRKVFVRSSKTSLEPRRARLERVSYLR